MIRRTERILENIPVGGLGLIALTGCEELGKKVDDYLVRWRRETAHEHRDDAAFAGYERDTYMINADVPRFGSGEAKGILKESVRGKDLYLMVDVCNYSVTYSLTGRTNHMSPDERPACTECDPVKRVRNRFSHLSVYQRAAAHSQRPEDRQRPYDGHQPG